MAEIIKDWKDILEQEDMNKVHLPGDVEDPWAIRILLLLEHHINNQLVSPQPVTLAHWSVNTSPTSLLSSIPAGRNPSNAWNLHPLLH